MLAISLRAAGGRAVGQGIIDALSRVAPEHQYGFWISPGVGYEEICGQSPGARTIVYQPSGGRLGRMMFERRDLPKQVAAFKPDRILSLDMRGLLSPPCPQAVFPQDSHLFYPHKHYGREHWRVRLVKAYDRRYLRKLLPAVRLLLCQTPVVERRIRDTYGYRGEALVCGSAVSRTLLEAPPEVPAPAPLRSLDGTFKLLSVGRYYAHKNLEALIELYRRHGDRLRDTATILTIAADQHPCAGRFLREVADAGLTDRIINVGPLSTEQVAAYYQHCDAMLMPTLLETFGLPYLEAMHFGKPILTSDLDFARQVCGEAAEFFDPWNVDSIAGAIERVKTDPARRESLIALGRSRLAQHYPTWDDITRGIITRLEQLA